MLQRKLLKLFGEVEFNVERSALALLGTVDFSEKTRVSVAVSNK